MPRAVVYLAMLLLPVAAAAQDRVVIATGADGQQRTLSGKIADFNGKELRFEVAGGQSVTIPTARVIEAAPARQAAHTLADQLFSQHKFAEALEAYRQATTDEDRVWLKRRIMADAVTSYEALGQLDRAGDAFVLLMKSDEHYQYFERIPLNWTSGLVDPALEQRAKAWLADDRLPPAQLLGASYLLAGADRAKVLATLRALSNSTDHRLAHLADAQVWRANIGTVGPQELKAWETQINRMPAELRSGPYLVLGKGWLQQDARMLGPAEESYRRAAWAFLKPPVLYPDRPAHALLGLSSAAEPLMKLAWDDEAASVLREVAQQFPTTDAGRAAAARLKQQPKP